MQNVLLFHGSSAYTNVPFIRYTYLAFVVLNRQKLQIMKCDLHQIKLCTAVCWRGYLLKDEKRQVCSLSGPTDLVTCSRQLRSL